MKGSDLVAHVTRVKYFTKDKEKFINPDNLKKYKKYLQSNIIKNQDVKDTTYKRYDTIVLDTPTSPNWRNSLNVCLVLSVSSFFTSLNSNSTKNIYILSINAYIFLPISIYFSYSYYSPVTVRHPNYNILSLIIRP